jgi:hypothetical protein
MADKTILIVDDTPADIAAALRRRLGGKRVRGCTGRWALPLSSSQVRSHVHALMKDADHVYQPGIGDTVEQHVSANGQFSVSGADVVDGAALSAPLSQGPAGIADGKSVARGLVLAPVPSGVLPDLFEVGLGGRG